MAKLMAVPETSSLPSWPKLSQSLGLIHVDINPTSLSEQHAAFLDCIMRAIRLVGKSIPLLG